MVGSTDSMRVLSKIESPIPLLPHLYTFGRSDPKFDLCPMPVYAQAHFSVFGLISDITVHHNVLPNGTEAAYALVTFKHMESFAKATESRFHKICGVVVKLKMAVVAKGKQMLLPLDPVHTRGPFFPGGPPSFKPSESTHLDSSDVGKENKCIDDVYGRSMPTCMPASALPVAAPHVMTVPVAAPMSPATIMNPMAMPMTIAIPDYVAPVPTPSLLPPGFTAPQHPFPAPSAYPYYAGNACYTNPTLPGAYYIQDQGYLAPDMWTAYVSPEQASSSC